MTPLLAAALFLPLFPLSTVLNATVTRLRHPLARCVLLLAWPQLGVLLLQIAPQPIPAAFTTWALLTSALYALRLLTVRDLGLWAGFFASSALALTWGLAADGRTAGLHLFAFWFSLPAALLALLAGPLARRLGAAYAGLHGGLASRLPRLAAVLVLIALAAVATPPFPGFFALLGLLHALAGPAALAVLVIWLVWGWAATKLLQGFVFGEERPQPVADIGRAAALAYFGALGVFAAAGLYLTGGGL
jgi:hypothetical protein